MGVKLHDWLFWINATGIVANTYNYQRSGHVVCLVAMIASFTGCWFTKD